MIRSRTFDLYLNWRAIGSCPLKKLTILGGKVKLQVLSYAAHRPFWNGKASLCVVRKLDCDVISSKIKAASAHVMRESDICLLRRDGLSIKRRQERSSGQSRLGHRPVNNRWPLSSKVLCEASSQTQIARPQEILCIDQLTETFAVKKKKSRKSSRCRSEMFPRRTLAATSSSLWRYNCYH